MPTFPVTRESITTLLESMLTVVTLLLACLSSLVGGSLPDVAKGAHNGDTFKYAQVIASILLAIAIGLTTMCWLACLAFIASLHSSKLGNNADAISTWYSQYRRYITYTLGGCIMNAVFLMCLLLTISWINSPGCMGDCTGNLYLSAVGVLSLCIGGTFGYKLLAAHRRVRRRMIETHNKKTRKTV